MKMILKMHSNKRPSFPKKMEYFQFTYFPVFVPIEALPGDGSFRRDAYDRFMERMGGLGGDPESG